MYELYIHALRQTHPPPHTRARAVTAEVSFWGWRDGSESIYRQNTSAHEVNEPLPHGGRNVIVSTRNGV